MFIALHSHLRHHRRKILTGLAVLAVATVAVAAHSAVMAGMGDHVADAAAICLTVGSCVAVVGVAVFTARRARQRPSWLIPAAPAPALPYLPATTGFLVRAGPPPLLQVFRL